MKLFVVKAVPNNCSFSFSLWVERISISPHVIRIQHIQTIAILHTYHCALSIYSFISLNRKDYVDLTAVLCGTSRIGYNVRVGCWLWGHHDTTKHSACTYQTRHVCLEYTRFIEVYKIYKCLRSRFAFLLVRLTEHPQLRRTVSAFVQVLRFSAIHINTHNF